jgi:hypothetical protein
MFFPNVLVKKVFTIETTFGIFLSALFSEGVTRPGILDLQIRLGDNEVRAWVTTHKFNNSYLIQRHQTA